MPVFNGVVSSLNAVIVTALLVVHNELGTEMRLRIGIASGRLVAGVIGTARFSYDLWGDTVNLASRVQTLTEPGTIRVTAAVAESATRQFQFVDGGLCEVKGLGLVEIRLRLGRTPAPAV
jgi:adenylate cyclase